jgi:hypothetical protein
LAIGAANIAAGLADAPEDNGPASTALVTKSAAQP